jgi:large subunit ribosomal protein L31e
MTEKKETKEEKKNERVYVIPTPTKGVAASKRASAATKMVREYVLKHSKAAKVRIDVDVNNLFWGRGIRNAPKSVKVKVTVDDDTAVASLVK